MAQHTWAYTESLRVLPKRRTTTPFAKGKVIMTSTMQRLMKVDFVEPRPPFIHHSPPHPDITASNMAWNALMMSGATLTRGLAIGFLRVEVERGGDLHLGLGPHALLLGELVGVLPL